VRSLVSQLGLEDVVQCLPNIAEDDLPALYSGAQVFVFPSIYEGFGLPPLEAMACGAPVLCCDTSSLPEVVGDAALRVGTDPAALAFGLTRLLEDVPLRETLSVAGQQRSQQFSWQRTAAATLAVYEGK
jgi:alpha-1,3-rhamnosyl/mannosyltransferase